MIKEVTWEDIGLSQDVDPYDHASPSALLKYVWQNYTSNQIVSLLFPNLTGFAKENTMNFIDENYEELRKLHQENVQHTESVYAEFCAYVVRENCDKFILRTGKGFTERITIMFGGIDEIIADENAQYFDKTGKRVTESYANSHIGEYIIQTQWLMRKYINSDGMIVRELVHSCKLEELDLSRLANHFLSK